jgi:hypothetical protein
MHCPSEVLGGRTAIDEFLPFGNLDRVDAAITADRAYRGFTGQQGMRPDAPHRHVV